MKFELIPFTELLSNIVDNRGKTCPTVETGIPLIATNCIRNTSLYPSYENVRYVSQETYDTWFRGHPEPGDFLFVTKGSPGRVCVVPDPIDFCIAQDMVAIRADPSRVYPHYLFAVLRSEYTQRAIENMHVGTLIPHFKKGDFIKLQLPLPDKETQVIIGDTYFTLSAKIELNRQLNTTLEQLARSLFQSWFVDFDPVRAKASGEPEASICRRLGLTPELLALFPAALEDSAMGEVPAGWQVKSLDEIATFLNGVAAQKYPPQGKYDLPVIKIAQLRKGNTEGADIANASAVPMAYIVEDGDVLFSWSGSLEVEIWSGGLGILNQHLFKVESEQFPKWFYFIWTRYHLPNFRLIASDKATTMGHIQRKHLTRAKVVVPNAGLLGKMNEHFAPFLSQMEELSAESRTLAALRDELLPKLLSGEILLN